MDINKIKEMSNAHFVNLLQENEACSTAVAWACEHGGTPTELWRDCERGDWMGWIIGKGALYEFPQKLAACLADVLRPISKFMPETAATEKNLQLYAMGNATIEDIEATGWTIGQAADAAGRAAGRAADAANAADAAIEAAEAASWAAEAAVEAAETAETAETASRAASRAAGLKKSAAVFRRHYPLF